ncbi:MAG: alpha/beta hydrolase [Roseateles sp.]|uniref:alpha/beta fold hydrolase n=1 Tax=Roseateles sp. TaxID=1971397 RepID=UPI0039E9B6E9
MSAAPLFALPGTLLDGRSLAAMLDGLAATTLLLGDCASLEDEVDRLAAHAPAPAVWLGHSLGGIVALHLAKRHPDRVAGLVLLGSNARAGRDTREDRRVAQWATAQLDGLTALVCDDLAPAYGLKAGADDAITASLAAQAEAIGLERFERQLGYARARTGLLAPRRPLRCPVLVLSGERDALCPPLHGNEITRLVEPPGRAEHHTLAGAGHLFPMQQPDLAAQHLRRFLHTLDEDAR